MTFNTSFAVGLNVNERTGEGKAGRKDIPGIFFVADENLNDRRGGMGGSEKKMLGGSGDEGGTIVSKIEGSR